MYLTGRYIPKLERCTPQITGKIINKEIYYIIYLTTIIKPNFKKNHVEGFLFTEGSAVLVFVPLKSWLRWVLVQYPLHVEKGD